MPTFEHDPEFIIKEGVRRMVAGSIWMKNSNRGEWIRVKWNVKEFLKLHIYRVAEVRGKTTPISRQ